MVFPSPIAVVRAVLDVWRGIVADVKAARATASDGGTTVTADELRDIAADAGLAIAEKLGELLLHANASRL